MNIFEEWEAQEDTSLERYEQQILKQLGVNKQNENQAFFNEHNIFTYQLAAVAGRYHVLALIKKPSVILDFFDDAVDAYGDSNTAIVFRSDMSNFTTVTNTLFKPVEDFDWCITRKYRNKIYHLFDLKPYFKECN